MLASLRIQNLALVERLDWELPSGFVAITGETGSGKSIILGALQLVLGERADKTLLRAGAESCTVEAVFQLGDTAAIDAQLAGQGIDPCAAGELILKRTFTAAGVNRQWINCGATTLVGLRGLGDALVDLHGPHDHQSLFSTEKQLELLDIFAGATALRRDYAQQFRTWQQLRAEHEDLAASENSLERERDLLAHQAGEIEAARLEPDEEETLHPRYHVARNSRRLIELSLQITQLLSEADDAALTRLAEVQRLFRELEKADPAQSANAATHASAIEQIEEVARALQHYAGHLEVDPGHLAQLEERVTLLESLKRKYGGELAAVIAFGEEARARLHRLENRGALIDRLAAEIKTAEAQVRTTGTALGGKRRVAAPKLAKQVRRELGDLGFQKAGFDITLTASNSPHATGLEAAEFLFAPNPGEPARPLRAIASSGEISRVMLALKTALAEEDAVPLLVFDEIDANLGGEIAHAVGAKMRRLGEAHQVLCITHLAQVAARAEAQFVVAKATTGQRTTSTLTAVSGRARLEEIARMLGGGGDSALAHARTLLTSGA